MDIDYDTLRRDWREALPRVRFRPYPEVDDDGLRYGAATVLATRDEDSENARAFALLSIAAGRPFPPESLRFLRRAIAQWDRGEKALAHFELA